MLTATDLLIILAILDTHKPPPPPLLVAAVEAEMDAAYEREGGGRADATPAD